MSAQPEVWRVSTVEGIFETDLETLKQWIIEGCVLPTDKVCKGNLSWIDAGRVPKLKAAFSGETTPAPEPNVSFETFVESNPAYGDSPGYSTVEPERVFSPHETTACHNHRPSGVRTSTPSQLIASTKLPVPGSTMPLTGPVMKLRML